MPLVRVEALRPARLTLAWLDADGQPVTPAGVSVSLQPAVGGSPISESATVVDNLATANFAAGALPALSRLSATWDAGTQGIVHQDVATVAGQPFSVYDLREADDKLEQLPADVLRMARDGAMDALEDACGVAFARRQEVEEFTLDADQPAGWTHLLAWPEVQSAAVTIDGAPASASVRPSGFLRCTAAARAGQVVRVLYVHGAATPPSRVSTAVLRMSVDALVNGPADDRIAAMRNPDSPFMSFVVAGINGARFSTPEANAVVDQFGYPHRGTV